MKHFKSAGLLTPIIFLNIWICAGCTNVPKTEMEDSTIPDVVKTGETGVLMQELIYPLESRPTPQCHASTIEETSTGLVAAWFGGTGEKQPDVGIWVSYNDGDGWSDPVEVVDGVQSDSLGYPCWNPVLFQPESGDLMLFYKVGPSPRDWWGMVMTSPDGGKSWSEPRRLGDGSDGDLIGPVKNKPVQLRDGTIICPSSRETLLADGTLIWNVHFERSVDGGASWELIGPIHDGVQIQAIQPSILFHRRSRIQVLCRTGQGFIAESWSEDGGGTWSPMQLTPIPNPNAGTDALTLDDGRQILVYNHTQRGNEFPSGRNMLNVAISDDGRTWRPVLTLERSEGEYSYPAVIQSSDGLLHITYTYMRESIKHVVVDPGEID